MGVWQILNFYDHICIKSHLRTALYTNICLPLSCNGLFHHQLALTWHLVHPRGTNLSTPVSLVWVKPGHGEGRKELKGLACFRCGEKGNFSHSCPIKRDDAKCSYKGCSNPNRHLIRAGIKMKKIRKKEVKENRQKKNQGRWKKKKRRWIEIIFQEGKVQRKRGLRHLILTHLDFHQNEWECNHALCNKLSRLNCTMLQDKLELSAMFLLCNLLYMLENLSLFSFVIIPLHQISKHVRKRSHINNIT